MKSQISNPHVCYAKIHHFGPTQKALPLQWLQVRRAERYRAQSKHPHPIYSDHRICPLEMALDGRGFDQNPHVVSAKSANVV